MTNEFRKNWIAKTHDVPIQHILDGVKELVHNMDEKLDAKEPETTTEKGEDKNYTVDIQYRMKEDTEWTTASYKVKARSDEEALNMATSLFHIEKDPIQQPNSPYIPCNYIMRMEGISIKKGAIDQTGKALNTIAEKAKEAESVEQKHDLISSLKAVQEKRQTAEINARKTTNDMRSFKDIWNKQTYE